jgi:hypothetical protein
MGLFSRKKPNRFIELLIEQAKYTVDGLNMLSQYVQKPDDQLARQLSQVEK